MKTLFFGIALAVSLLHSPMLAAQFNLVTNGSFETGDLTGWTEVNSGDGQFSVESGTVTPSSGGPIPAPPDGTFASVSDQGGAGSHILYQDVSIPTHGDITLSLLLYYNNRANVWVDNGTLSESGGANQQLRVDIMDPSAAVDDVGTGVLMNIIKPSGSDPFTFGYNTLSADLNQFAGQTIRLRFAEVDNQLFLNMAIDDVRISQFIGIPVDQPLALLLLILGIMILATIGIRRSQHAA